MQSSFQRRGRRFQKKAAADVGASDRGAGADAAAAAEAEAEATTTQLLTTATNARSKAAKTKVPLLYQKKTTAVFFTQVNLI